jgi:Flp pilus assembly protein TadD
MGLNLQALAVAVSTIALTACGTFQQADTPHAQVTLRVADAAMASGAPDMALRVAQLVLDRQPNNVEAIVAKGDALYAMGVPDQAREAYRTAVALDANNSAAQIGLGRTLVRSDPQGAETHFLAALARQPDSVVALNNLGIARDLQGRHAEAQQAYRQALAIAPEMADVKTNLGLSLALAGQGNQAVQVLQPIGTASDATALKRADLAVAVVQAGNTGPSGPIKVEPAQNASVRYDAPIAPVESQMLPPRTVEQSAPPVAIAGPAPVAAVPSTPGQPALPVAVATPVTMAPAAVAAPEQPVQQIEQPMTATKAVTPLPAASAPAPDQPVKQPATPATIATPPAPEALEMSMPQIVQAAAAVRPTPVPAPAAPSREAQAAPDGIYVQMASLDSEQAARTEWQRMRARWPDLFGDRAPAVEKAEVRDRTFWRLRTGGFSSVVDANEFCGRLRATGASCWTVGLSARS